MREVKYVPRADERSARMGWFFDPGFIENVQRVASDVENPSMESIDSVLFALREMGYIKTAGTCEHGFSVDECVTGLCELQTENAALLARHNDLLASLEELYGYLCVSDRDGESTIPEGAGERARMAIARARGEGS